MKSVAWLPAGRDACALYRMLIPSMHTQNSSFILSEGMMPLEEFVDVDVTVVQRIATKGNLEAIKIMHQCGMRVVFDLDDNVWSIPKYNPAQQAYETIKEGIGVCALEADVLTVSTQALKDAVIKYVPEFKKRRVEVIPNAVDFDYFQPKVMYPDRLFTVGWGGTNTHSEDTRKVFDCVASVVKDRNDIRFETVGLPMPEKLKDHKRAATREYVPVAEYAARLASWGWDLFIAPLEYNEFNRSKSNIKILEAACVGSPILVSDVGEYGKFCRMDKELQYLLCNSDTDWKRKIVELKNEPKHREALVLKMRKVVRQNFEAKTVAKQWRAVFESA